MFNLSKTLTSVLVTVLAIAIGPGAPTRAASINDPFDFPKLETVEDKIRYIFWVKKHFPKVFENAQKFDYSLVEIIDLQKGIMEQLALEDDYQAAKAARSKDLLQMDIELRGEEVVEIKQLDPKAVKEWKKELSEPIFSMPDGEGFGSRLEGQIRDGLAARPKIDRELGPVLGGLNRAIPGDRKSAYGAMSVSEKVDLLEKVLPEDLSATGFDPRRAGLAGQVESKADLIDYLRDRARQLESLQRQIQLHVLLQDEAGSVSMSRSEAMAAINAIEEAELDPLVDPTLRQSRVAALKERVTSEDTVKAFSRGVSNAETAIDAKLSRQISKDVVLKGKYRIQELPLSLSVFRGCAGGDCSTAYSSGYANSLEERTFAVMDDSGEVLGYFSGTNTHSYLGDGDTRVDNFYLHTMNGEKIDGAVAKLVLQEVENNIGKFGRERLVLPESGSLNGFVNYSEIRNQFREIPTLEEASQFYENVDSQLRYFKFKTSDRVDYDMPSKNDTVMVAGKTPDPVSGVTTQIRSVENPFVVSLSDIDRSEVILHALDLQLGLKDLPADKRKLQAQAIRGMLNLEEVNLPLREFNAVVAAVKNRQRLPVADYEKSVTSALEGIGVRVDSRFRKKKTHLYREGHFRSRDAYKRKNFDRMVEVLIELYNTNDEIPERAVRRVRKLKKQLIADPTLRAFLNSRLADGDLHAYGSMLQTFTYPLDGFPILEEDTFRALIKENTPFTHPHFLERLEMFVERPSPELLEDVAKRAVDIAKSGDYLGQPQVVDPRGGGNIIMRAEAEREVVKWYLDIPEDSDELARRAAFHSEPTALQKFRDEFRPRDPEVIRTLLNEALDFEALDEMEKGSWRSDRIHELLGRAGFEDPDFFLEAFDSIHDAKPGKSRYRSDFGKTVTSMIKEASGNGKLRRGIISRIKNKPAGSLVPGTPGRKRYLALLGHIGPRGPRAKKYLESADFAKVFGELREQEKIFLTGRLKIADADSVKWLREILKSDAFEDLKHQAALALSELGYRDGQVIEAVTSVRRTVDPQTGASQVVKNVVSPYVQGYTGEAPLQRVHYLGADFLEHKEGYIHPLEGLLSDLKNSAQRGNIYEDELYTQVSFFEAHRTGHMDVYDGEVSFRSYIRDLGPQESRYLMRLYNEGNYELRARMIESSQKLLEALPPPGPNVVRGADHGLKKLDEYHRIARKILRKARTSGDPKLQRLAKGEMSSDDIVRMVLRSAGCR